MNTFYGNFHRILPHLHFFYSDSIASYKLNLKYFLKDGKKKSLCLLIIFARVETDYLSITIVLSKNDRMS